jgi:hypothetical protein
LVRKNLYGVWEEELGGLVWGWGWGNCDWGALFGVFFGMVDVDLI